MDLDDDLLAKLRGVDTPTICNALELLVPERRGHGYTVESLVCLRPELGPMVGVARTATIRCAGPSGMSSDEAGALSHGYYSYIDVGQKPSVIVIQDIDERKGFGAFWGEVNSSIHAGLGCVGLITDGGIRDLPDIAPSFQMLAGRVVPSHAFVHLVSFGEPVDVAGMRVCDGDLIHADRHGAVVIPWEVARQASPVADEVYQRERVIIEAARQPNFTADVLRDLREVTS